MKKFRMIYSMQCKQDSRGRRGNLIGMRITAEFLWYFSFTGAGSLERGEC